MIDPVAHWFEKPKGLKKPSPGQFDFVRRRAESQFWHLAKQRWEEADRNREHTYRQLDKVADAGVDIEPLLAKWWQIVLPEWERQAGCSWGEHQQRISQGRS